MGRIQVSDQAVDCGRLSSAVGSQQAEKFVLVNSKPVGLDSVERSGATFLVEYLCLLIHCYYLDDLKYVFMIDTQAC